MLEHHHHNLLIHILSLCKTKVAEESLNEKTNGLNEQGAELKEVIKFGTCINQTNSKQAFTCLL